MPLIVVDLGCRLRLRFWGLLLVLTLLLSCMHAPVNPSFGMTDPYLWLESPVTSAPVSTWLAQQAGKTRDWQQQQSHYHKTREHLLAAWDHPKWMVADIKNGDVFFYHNPGLADQYSLYQQPYADFVDDRAADGALSDSARLLLGADAFPTGTRPGDISISPDAAWLAYQVNRAAVSGGLDSRWYLQSLTSVSREPVPVGLPYKGWYLPAERLTWGETGDVFFTVSVPASPGQAGGESDFSWQSRVYRYQPAMREFEPELVYIEAVGRQIEQLHVIEDMPGPRSEAGKHGNTLLVAVAALSQAQSDSRPSGWRVLKLDTVSPARLARAEWLSFDHAYHRNSGFAQYVGVVRGDYAFRTNGARGTGSITRVNRQGAQTFITETEMPLLSALVLGRRLVLEYLQHGSSTLRVVDLYGRPEPDNHTLALPAPVRVDAVRALGEHQLLVSYSGILTPPRSELVDLQSGRKITLTQDRPKIRSTDLQARLVQVRSDDGTRVPLWIAGARASPGGDSATSLLEVYGGFAAPMETAFSISRLAWMDAGGVYAVAGPRGGGDYGEYWHGAGSGERRDNSIADVLAVAEWLRDESQADNGRLVISGRSHGGLLAAEVVHRAPHMFAAVVAEAAVFDLVRLDALGGAPFWQDEYLGFTSSPYHALLAGGPGLAEHPPALLITRSHDPVVAPAHSFKYLQALQVLREHKPFAGLLYIARGQGHDASGRVNELIDDYAMRWTFLNSRLLTGLSPD